MLGAVRARNVLCFDYVSPKQIVLKGYAALKAGDVASYFHSMTEDVSITASATTRSPAPIAAKRTWAPT